MPFAGFKTFGLSVDHCVSEGRLPAEMIPTEEAFEAIWNLHPQQQAKLRIHGRTVIAPRFQQAFGQDYRFSGQVSSSQPMPELYAPYLAWAQVAISPRLNGLLVNWYDAAEGHYIGKHRDSTIGLIDRVPVVTISLGASRVMRFRPWKGQRYRDLELEEGSVVVIPRNTNDCWTHEVLHRASDTGRRVSVTLRGLESQIG